MKRHWRNAKAIPEGDGLGNASVSENFSTMCPFLVHSSASSIKTRDAPKRGSQARFTTTRMRSGLSIILQDRNAARGATIRIKELIIKPEHIFRMVTRRR